MKESICQVISALYKIVLIYWHHTTSVKAPLYFMSNLLNINRISHFNIELWIIITFDKTLNPYIQINGKLRIYGRVFLQFFLCFRPIISNIFLKLCHLLTIHLYNLLQNSYVKHLYLCIHYFKLRFLLHFRG